MSGAVRGDDIFAGEQSKLYDGNFAVNANLWFASFKQS